MERRDSAPRIFVSFAQPDASFVQWLTNELKTLGYNLWLDQSAILGGVQPFDRIQNAMDQSALMLLVISPSASKSHLVKSEWMYFLSDSHKRVIPLLLEPLAPPDKINFMLASLDSVDFYRADHETALAMLDQALHEAFEDGNGEAQKLLGAPFASFATPDRFQADDRLPTRDAGILHMHEGMPLTAFVNWISEARHVVRVLSTWTGAFVDYAEPLIHAARRGARVQILLLDPSSAFARQRSRDIYLGAPDQVSVDANEVPQNIRTSIRQLASLHAEIGDSSAQLELRLYDLLPSCSIHQSDDRALVGFFPHAGRTTTFPMLETQINSPFGKHFEEEFIHIWDSSMPVDLALYFAPEVETANRALLAPLSARELEILSLICAGLSNQEIADQLVVEIGTVKKHINNLYSKIDVTSRTRAVLRGLELGIVRSSLRL